MLQAFIIPALLLRRFAALEQQQLKDTGEAANRAYQREKIRLSAFTKNFAAWTESYLFAQGLRPTFLSSNLVPSTFEGGNVTMWGITDRAGVLLSAATYRSSGIQTDAAARRLIQQSLQQLPRSASQTAAGVIQVSGKYYLVAGQPITQDDGTGLAGRFLLGRELTASTLSQIVSLGLDSQLQLAPLTSALSSQVRDRLTFTLPLTNPKNEPSALLRVTQSRPILQSGRQATEQISVVTALSAFMVLALGTTFFRRRVLLVIEQYNSGVSRMQGDPDHRLTIHAPDELGELASTVNSLTDQYRRQYAEIQTIHRRDGLTGLLNRTGLLSTTGQDHLTCAAVIQIGSLESLSGLYGAVRADRLIMEFAARLSTHAPGALCARVRSDTFVLLSDQPLSSLQPALTAATRPHSIGGGEIQLRILFGQVEMDCPQSAESLLECAELALQETHELGGTSRTYTRQTRQRLERTRALEASLRHMTEDTLTLHYQPIVHLNGQIPVAFEALARWNHPQLGVISPAEFIPLAERGGQIYALGQWVLRRAAQDLLHTGHPTLKVNVNVSPLQLLSPSFAEDILATVQRTGLTPDRLVLEVTESAVLEDLERAIVHLSALRAAGIQIALDDFGAGYSSLSLLSRLPVDVIKLDRTFLTEALWQPAARIVLTQIVALTGQLGLPVIAEGIENLDTLALLRQVGVWEGQGYLLGRPAPFEESLGRLGMNP
ncbi:putative bifunctional diguanylate cyclase/phosphodiesterase [Deinococcus sp. A31D244]|uniref:putative bifunctional diguanylate cyclase/phosphodiesterase n=1 Tax=Deinococcus sp. A31D244 TaxID=3397675 RepID=UPI0039E0043B